uniref:Vesicular, overexpressed in cancer, prosurvival protein 1 n=1 Tax=Haemonchus contortus TaxID=6289 RepID=A0A7I5EBC2_HAECO|nr:Hypothetical protein CBG10735 [Haemonchus contortus]
MSTNDDDNILVCTINKSEPAYQPNVYLCQKNSYCCTYYGASVCCYTDITLDEVLTQMWPTATIFICFLLVAAVVNWYFSDDETDYDFEKERSKRTVIRLLYPTDENDTVNDPLFGPRYVEKVPRKAYVNKNEEDADEPAPTPRPILDEC